MRKKNDVLLKSAFEEAFPELLRFFFEDADRLFDIDRGFEFLDKELKELFPETEKKGGNRFVDMLVKIYSTDGSEKWVLVHIEIQAQYDPGFGLRMFQYFYRIFDRYSVPITSLAVFTGEKSQICDQEFRYEFLGTTLQYRFNTYHILDHTEEQLLAMDNRFGLIILAVQKTLSTDKLSFQQLAEQRFNIAKAIVSSNKYNSEQIRRFLYFLKKFIRIENREINRIFEKQIELLTGENSTMGIIETVQMLAREEGKEREMLEELAEFDRALARGRERGIQKAIEETNRKFVARLLQKTDLDLAKIALIVEVEESFVQETAAQLNRKP